MATDLREVARALFKAADTRWTNTSLGPDEGLSEAELAIFDLLTRPEPKLTQAQEITAKAAARSLMGKLQDLLTVRDWHLRQQPRAAVMSAIRVELNTLPEDPYPLPLWEGKVEDVWQFVATRYGAAVPPSACA